MFLQRLKNGFSNYAESGESFELIDGENMRSHDAELSVLLSDFVKKKEKRAGNKDIRLYVVSQIGKQSVGKSFLFNHMFKTKFLNRSGRCTQGINIAFRDFKNLELNDEKAKPSSDKLLILDTEGLGSLDKVKRLKGKDMNFDRVMVLFCLTVSNALIITLKSEIDSETADLLAVCCWALQNLKINKTAPPHIFFVLNQQTDTNKERYMDGLQACIDQITDNPLYSRDKVKEYINISEENFIVLPTAFKQESRNFNDLYNFPVQRQIIQPYFTEKCQDLGLKIIRTIQTDSRSCLRNFESFMKIAGDSFRTITSFPELLRFKNVNEYICNRQLRDKVFNLVNNNQIITSEYQKINHDIITSIQNLELKMIFNTDDFVQERLQPLHDRYDEHQKCLKVEYDNFSSAKLFADHPSVVEANAMILSKQCNKQYQYFKNIINDLISERCKMKAQKNLEDKVNELIRRNTDIFIKQDRHKWKANFDRLWDDAQNQVYKNKNIPNASPLDQFWKLLKEQYGIFSLESLDNDKMTLPRIYEVYLTKFIVQQKEYETSQDLDSPSSLKKIEQLNMTNIVDQIIQQLSEDIKSTFKGNLRKQFSIDDHKVTFFEANTKRIPPGKLKNITGKTSKQPKYLRLESISERQQVSDSMVKQNSFANKFKPSKEAEPVPAMGIPQDLHAIVYKLLGKNAELYTNSSNYDQQAVKLASILPSVLNEKKNVWDDFMDTLEMQIRQEIHQKEEINRTQSITRRSRTDQYNQFRSIDQKNYRVALSIVQQYIQDIDFELGFIWVNLSTYARCYLNTLIFFICLEHNILLREQKNQLEQQQKIFEKQEFYKTFEKNMVEKQKQRLDGLTDKEMQNHDEFKSMYMAQKIMCLIENESRNLTYNFIVSQMQSVANSDLSNRSIVLSMNSQVKEHVTDPNIPEATNNSDQGVQYIVDYHGLIEETFKRKWKIHEKKQFESAGIHFKEQVNNSMIIILNVFKFLLSEMRNILKMTNKDDDLLLGRLNIEECFHTHELFKIYELDDKFGTFKKLPKKRSLNHGSSCSKTTMKSGFIKGGRAVSMDSNEMSLGFDSGEEHKSGKEKKKNMKESFADFRSNFSDMNFLNDESDVSVDSVNLSENLNDEEDESYVNILQSKLNLDLYKIPVNYLKWFLDPSIKTHISIKQAPAATSDADPDALVSVIEYDKQKFELIQTHTYPFFGQSKEKQSDKIPNLTDAIFNKVRATGMLDPEKNEIYNLYRFINNMVDTLSKADINLEFEEYLSMAESHLLDLEQRSKGCRERCPACNKYCEEPFNHMAQEGVKSSHSCSKYGHQFFSMGGRMWQQNTRKCILVQCHDDRLADFQAIKKISGQEEKWSEFKSRYNDWIWDCGDIGDEDFGLNFMIDLHNKCGRQAFCYYKEKNPQVDIQFRPYLPEDSVSMEGLEKSKQICFVIDGTKSMHTEIKKVRKAILKFTENRMHKQVAIIIYRDHDCKTLFEVFPSNRLFTSDMQAVVKFLKGVKTNEKSASYNEAALDGLAVAASLNWGESDEKDLLVIHISDAMPHGNWPDYEKHHERSNVPGDHCCCCPGKCDFKWEPDVFVPFRAKKIKYHSIFTYDKNRSYWFSSSKVYNEGFDQVMRRELGEELCPESRFQFTERDLVDIKINEIVLQDNNF